MATAPKTNEGAWNRVRRFFREVRGEVRKVVWPNRQELLKFTGVVIFTVVLVAIFIGVSDLVIAQILQLLRTLGG
ncbi:MAG TPA: preprotein translocase subunit SecE [Firmicutes bacterium]|nr:preprotein translocase subunit SecE [Bacillota bacterium]